MPADLLPFKSIEKTLAQNPARPDLADGRDFLAGEILRPVGLPATFSLRGLQTPSRNQGQRGTCTAHVVAAIAEYFDRLESGRADADLSEEFVFRKTKEIDLADYNYDGYGAYLRSAAKAFAQFGACSEAGLGYRFDAAEDSWKQIFVSPANLAEAANYRAKSYASVAISIEAMQQALVASNAPLLAGFNLYSSYRSARDTGRIPVRSSSDSLIGGHAMAVVGYTADSFICKNSWGTGWGDGGYVYWPFAMLDQVFSVWSFVDEASNPAVNPAGIVRAQQGLVPDWAKDSVAWAAKSGIMKQVTGEPLPDYRLVTILDNYEQYLVKKYGLKKK